MAYFMLYTIGTIVACIVLSVLICYCRGYYLKKHSRVGATTEHVAVVRRSTPPKPPSYPLNLAPPYEMAGPSPYAAPPPYYAYPPPAYHPPQWVDHPANGQLDLNPPHMPPQPTTPHLQSLPSLDSEPPPYPGSPLPPTEPTVPGPNTPR